MSQREFRIKDTRFRRVERRDGSVLLYRANSDGIASWWFLGQFTTEHGRQGWRAAAKRAAKPKPVLARRDAREGRSLPDIKFRGRLSRIQKVNLPHE